MLQHLNPQSKWMQTWHFWYCFLTLNSLKDRKTDTHTHAHRGSDLLCHCVTYVT